MLTEFNKIYSLEIDLKNLEVVHNSKALYANSDLNTSTMLIKLSLDKKPLDVTNKTITAYIKTGKDQIVTMQRCAILEAEEGIVGLDFKSSALKIGTNVFFLEIKSEHDEIINSPLVTYKVVELFDIDSGSEGENNVTILSQIITDVDILKTAVVSLESEIALLKKSIEELPNINVAAKEIQLQKGEEYIQWRYVDEEEWRNLVALEELKVKGDKGEKGEKGDKGDTGERGQDGVIGKDGKSLEFHWNNTHLGIRVEGNSDYEYVNLKGATGTTGAKGDKGDKGETGAKGEKGDKGDKGIYIGSKDNAPSTADIIIDNSDEGIYMNELVTTPIINSTLNLTSNKYQTTTMENNTTITLPNVSRFTEIHLFFTTAEELTILLPKIKWQNDISIEANKKYEFIFTYADEWLGGCVVYE